jgi:predicted TPR repeat methyltransferase
LIADSYDRKAEEYNWRGPEVAFGLSYKFINPGESVLDIGIGTGLSSALFHKSGLRVFGMDDSAEMLEACKQKGFAADLKKHNLIVEPYPYDTASLDHVVCIGVLDFFSDLRPVFREVARILRDKGTFTFAVANRGPGEGPEYTAGPESTQSDSTVTMYRRSTEEVNALLKDNGFESLMFVVFSVFMDPEQTIPLPLKAYVARRIRHI